VSRVTSIAAPPPCILIIGPGKTGTTGLYASVKAGLVQAGRPVQAIFEPPNALALDSLFAHAPQSGVLVKTTIDSAESTVPDPFVFDHRVMTSRDPRDMLISSLLFRPLTVASLRRTDDAAIGEFVNALRGKEADPSSVSVRELFDLAERVGIGAPPYEAMLADLARQRDFLERYPCHLMQYERFVNNDLDDLSNYLGFAVANVSARDSSMFGHIARSQGSGEFVQWFLADDLSFFNEQFGEFLDTFGYSREIELPAQPAIDPATASDYVSSRTHERRASLQTVAETRTVEWRPTDVDSLEALDRLRDYGIDGNGNSCVRVAEVLLSGHLGPRDEDEALRWARRGAELGSVRGVHVLVDLLGQLAGDDPALHRERRAWQSVQALRSRRKPDPAVAKLAELTAELAEARSRIVTLERELAGLRRSTSYRLGAQLARAARDPRHQAGPAARELRIMWRERRRRA
jgi:hypothetical protein